ncbi:MAG: alkaline phosphatase family protein [Candidatus Binatus sp.]
MPTDLAQIQTVIILLMENRSFDHMLGYLRLPACGGNINVDGVRDDQAWLNAVANKWQGFLYQPGPLLEPRIPDPPHERPDIATQLGQVGANGFPLDGFIASASGDSEVMRYQTPDKIPILDFFARNFRICDHWFSPLPASTQPNRLMAMAGYSLIDGNVPVLPNHVLVYDWLNAHSVSWRVYHQGFFPFFSIMPRWLPEIATSDKFREFDRFATDMELESDDTFPQVIFVEPIYTDAPHAEAEGTDDHSPSSVTGGQRLMLDVYSALLRSRHWNNSILIVTYDEHGGFFDHVQPLPVETTPPAGQYAPFPTTGVRVPAVIVSPFVSAGSVCNANFDHTSILKFLGQKFGMGGGYSPEVDRHALVGSVADILDSAAPQPDRPAPPAPTAIVEPSTTLPAPLPPSNQNVEAFKQVAQQMKDNYPQQLATKFPASRRVLGF